MIRLLAILLVLLPLAAMAAPAPRMFSTLADALNSTPQSYAVAGKAELQVNGRVVSGDWGPPRIGHGVMGAAAATNFAYVLNFTNGWGQLSFEDDTPVNVRHFGAVDDPMDESTDSTDAILEALSYAGTRASVYFPNGRYIVKKPLPLADRLHVFGDGDGSMISVQHGGAGWQNPTPATRLYEILIRDLAINTAGGERALAAITLTNVSYARIENVFVHAFDGKGFQYGIKSWGDSPDGGAWSSSIIGNRIYAYSYTNGPAYAIHGSGGPAWGWGPNSWRILDNYLNIQPASVFNTNFTEEGSAVIYLENFNGAMLTDNITEGYYTNCVYVTNATAFTIKGTRFEHGYNVPLGRWSGGTNFVAISLHSVTNATIVGNMPQGIGDKSSVIRPSNPQATILEPAWGGPHTIDGDLIIGKTWDLDHKNFFPTLDHYALVDSTEAVTRLGIGVRTVDAYTNNPRAILTLYANPTNGMSWAGIAHGSSRETIPFYWYASITNFSITALGAAVLGLPLPGAEFTTYGDIAGGSVPSLWAGSIPSGPLFSMTGRTNSETVGFVFGIQEPPGAPTTNNLRLAGGAHGPSQRTYLLSGSSAASPPLDIMVGVTTGAVFTANGASIMGHPVSSAELTVVGDVAAGPNPRMPFSLSPADYDVSIYSDAPSDSIGFTAGIYDAINNPRFSFTYLGPSARSQINSSGSLTNPPIDFMVGPVTGAVITAGGASVLGHPVSGGELTVFGDIYAGPQPNAWTASKAGAGNLTITAADTNAMPSVIVGHQGGANSRVELVTSNLLARLVATSSAGAIPWEVWAGSQRVARFDASLGLVVHSGLPLSIGGESFTDISGTNLIVAGNKLNVYGLSAEGHTHDASNTVSGQFESARLGSGTSDTDTFLRGGEPPTWDQLSADDIPNLPASRITSETFDSARMGTGTATTNTFLQGDGSGGAFWGTVPSTPSPTNGIADAPADGIFYGRLNNAWTQPDISDLSGVSGWGLAWIDGTVVDDVDALTTLGLLGGGPTTIDSPAKYAVRVGSGGTVSTRHRLNMIASTGLTLAISDDAINDESDVTVSIADRDWGDITSTSSGSVWNIDADAVGSAEIATGAVGTTEVDDNAVTYAKIQNVVASRVLGRGAGAGDGDPEELTIGPGLAMTGAAIHTNPVVVAASKLIGRGSAAGSGAAEEITVGPGLTMTGTTLDVTPPSSGFSTVLGNTDAVTVPDTESAETTLIGTIRSGESATFGAGTLATGTIVKVEAMGTLSASGNWADGVLRVKFGSSRSLAFTVLEPDSYTATDYTWRLTAWLSVTAAGASATTVLSGLLEYEYPNDADTPGVRRLRHLSGTASGTLDTTGSNAFDVTWDNASGLEVDWTCNHLLVTRY